MKFFIDLAKDIVILIKAFGGLKTIFVQIMAMVAIHKVQMMGMVAAQRLFTAEEIKGFSATTLFKLGLTQLKTTMDITKVSAIGLQASVFALIAVFGLVISAIQSANQEHEAMIERQIEAGEAATANLKALSENVNKYKELASSMSLTSTEAEELDDVENTLVNTLGEKAEALSHLKKGTDEYRDAVIKLTEAEIERLKLDKEKALTAAKEKFTGTVNPVFGYGLDGQAWQISSGWDKAGEAVLGGLGLTDAYALGGATFLPILNAKREYMYGDMNEIQYGVAEYEAARKALEELEKAAHNFRIAQDDLSAGAIENGDYYKNLTKIVERDREAFEQWRDTQFDVFVSLTSGNNAIIDSQQEYANLLSRIVESNDLNNQQKRILIELAEQTYPSFSESVEVADIQIKKLTTSFAEELDSLKELDSAYSALSSAVDEYNENGYLSANTIETLINKYSDYLQYLVDEDGQLVLNESSLRDLVEAKKEDIKATIIQEALNRIDSLKAQSKEEQELASSIAQQTEEIKKNNQARFEALALLPMEDFGENAEAFKKIIDETQQKLALLSQWFVGGGSGSGSSSSKKTTDVWKEAFTKAYNDLKNRRDRDLIDNEQYYKELGELNDKYFKDRVEYAEEYAKYELELYKGLQTLFKEYIDELNHEYTMLENQGADKNTLIDKYKEIQEELHRQAEYYRSLNLEGNKELIDDLSEQWWKYQKNIDKLSQEIEEERKKQVEERFSNLRDVALEIIESQIKEKQAALEEQNALLDEQIDKYKEEEDTLGDQKDIEEKLLKIEEARKKLAEAKNQKVRIYREGQGFVYETDFDAVYSAQKELDSLLEDWNLFQEKARISDIVAQLENEKQANKDRVDQEIADLNKLKDAWDKSLDMAKNVEDYQGWLTKIKNTENKSFQERLKSVQEFVKAYNREMNSLQTNVANVTSTQSGSSGDYSGVVTKKYNGVEYNPNVDYQALINNAESSGAPGDYLVELEKKRNAKIMGEGMTEQQMTYKYTSGGGSSSSKSSKSSSPESSSQSAHSPVRESSSSGGSLLNTAVNFIKSITGLASGTEHADGMPHFVGEDGPELYVPPRGSSIIPNDLTSNLMAWGSINPMQLVGAMSGGGNTTIEVSNITLPNVTDAHSFVEELKNFKGFAVQKQSYRV